MLGGIGFGLGVRRRGWGGEDGRWWSRCLAGLESGTYLAKVRYLRYSGRVRDRGIGRG